MFLSIYPLKDSCQHTTSLATSLAFFPFFSFVISSNYLSTHRWGCTSMIYAFHFYLKSRHYSTSGNKECSQTTPFHLTRLFELRKSYWELCDSQRVWKSQVSDVFVRNPVILAKQHVVCDKTTRHSSNFKGHFSNSFPRNFFFFPWNFENVRRNFISVGENREKFRQNQENLGEWQEKFENPCKICRKNDFKLTYKTLVPS